MLITALLMTAALTGAPEGPGGDPDGVMATAPATTVILDATVAPVAPPVQDVDQTADPHGLSTDQQIAQWLAARAPAASPDGDLSVWRHDREPHGEVSVGFGTGGYRDYGAAVSLPLGESGQLDISVRHIKNGYPYGYGYGGGYGYDPYFDDGGYLFPRRAAPGAALDYQRRLSRPDGAPDRRSIRPLPSAAE